MSRMIALTGLLLLFTGFAAPAPQAQPAAEGETSGTVASVAARSPSPESVAAVDTYLSRLAKLGFAGTLMVAKRGVPLLEKGYGLADRERQEPWTPGTVSTIGSITKQYTGAAILVLEQEGRLSAADSITRYFSDVPEDKREITLHQLLTHSSGIVDLDGFGDWDPIGRQEFVRRALKQPLAFAPGTSYRYSNAGYSLLGAIIEQLSGSSYETFLRQRVLAPAGVYETGYLLPAWDRTRLAAGYIGDARWGTLLERPMADDGPYWVLRANGGLHSTAYDMLRWGQALLDGRVLSAPSMEKYWAPHVSEGGDSYYGYGWVILDLGEGVKVITHNGGNGIHFADMALVPSLGLVVFLQTNVAADLPLVEGLLERIGYALLKGEDLPAVPDMVAAEDAALEAFAGDYRLERGGVARVSAAAGELRVAPLDARAFTQLLSTRPIDFERAERLSSRIDRIVAAYLKDDWSPLWEAYERRVSRERLREMWGGQMQQWQQRHGPPRGYAIVGTAFREGRDVTLVRFDFEGGSEYRTYVWSLDASADLRGVSRRGVAARLRVVPVSGGGFATWDRRTGGSRPVSLEVDAAGEIRFQLGEGATAVTGVR